MTIGEKVKAIRQNKGMTQSELAKGKITRNMLSAIESGKATPSLDTLYFLASALDVPVDYLVSSRYSLDFYVKNELLFDIKKEYSAKNYKKCVELISQISELDDELYYILASCTFELGADATQFGSLRTAKGYLEQSLECSKRTVYDTSRFESVIPMYLSVINNVSAPLLEFDINKYENDLSLTMHYEFYKYLISDFDFTYENQNYKMHLEAKSRIKERKYEEAIRILHEIENNKLNGQYSVYLMLGVYTDLDNCYKQLRDFENAHRYSTKRITLIENLNA